MFASRHGIAQVRINLPAARIHKHPLYEIEMKGEKRRYFQILTKFTFI